MTGTLPEKISTQKEIRTLSSKQDEVWPDCDTSTKAIEKQKDALIDEVEARMHQTIEEEPLFTIQWKLI